MNIQAMDLKAFEINDSRLPFDYVISTVFRIFNDIEGLEGNWSFVRRKPRIGVMRRNYAAVGQLKT